MYPRKPWASPEVVDQILRLGRAEEPNEACGVVTPDSRVMQLPNRSPSPHTSFVIATEDLVTEIHGWMLANEVAGDDLSEEHFMVWHTHPGGVIGPSSGDLENRIEGFSNLVVSMPRGEATLF